MIFNLFSKKAGTDNKKTVSNKMNIVFPCYRGGEYETLADAVKSLMESEDTFHLGEIIQYNIKYRDYLREHGIDELIDLMLREAPMLRQDEKAVMKIYERFRQMGGIADYDIQCYDITKPIPVLGKELPFSTIGGKNVERFLGESRLGDPKPWRNEQAIENEFGLHLGQVYDSYPRFDSSDWSDDRSYQNYIIRTSPIKKKEMLELMKVEALGNRQRVHEHLPKHLLPVLYYVGDGRFALLATAKS